MSWNDVFVDMGFDSLTETKSTIGSWLDDAGDWMSDNPGATAAIGGAATAGLNYLNSEKQRKFDQRREREERDWRDSRSQASSGTDNYGSHYQGLTKGLLVK